MEIFDARTVDLVALSPDGTTVCLYIVSDSEWTGSDAQINSLQSKIHAYVGYVLDGQMAAAYPETHDPPWQIVLRCRQGAPDARTGQVLAQLVETVRRYGGDLVIAA
jgi:hypothetical protein